MNSLYKWGVAGLVASLLVLSGCGHKPIAGSFDDKFRYSCSERSDLCSHMGLTYAGAVVGGYALQEAGIEYADEIAAVGSFALLTSKEFVKDDWVDRGDIGANALGALSGYITRKFLTWEW